MKLYIDHADASIATKDFELCKLKDEITKLESTNKSLINQLDELTIKMKSLEDEICEYKDSNFRNTSNYRTTNNSTSKKHIKNHSVNLDDISSCINLTRKISDNKIRNNFSNKLGSDSKKIGYSSCLTGFGAFKSGIIKRKIEDQNSSNGKITALTKKPLSNSPQHTETKYKKKKQASTSHNFNYSKEISNKNLGIHTINIRQLISSAVNNKPKGHGENNQVRGKQTSNGIKSNSKKKSDKPVLKTFNNCDAGGMVKDIRESKNFVKL